jgi:hypothetical protein
MTEFKGYPTFTDLDNDLLQAWNRCEIIADINKSCGADLAQDYFDTFNEVEQMKIKMLLLMVSSCGKEETKKQILASLEEDISDEQL